MLYGFRAQHRATGKFYPPWAADEDEARVVIADHLGVPRAEILKPVPTQQIDRDAWRPAVSVLNAEKAA